uniref:uncharacterized protein LOC120327144 n=1 Tax=Styela clava TaxID=7725 RepID=UPI001939E371|nr:uncharacterized protein LOC120327144 [Styela clava]
MWFYFYPHMLFHMTRWFPKNNRVKFRILALIISLSLLIPELYILLLPRSERACEQPLLSILVASTIFLFFTVGFGTLFTLFEPIPRIMNLAFHIFGILSFILGLVTTVYTFQATACSETTTELYYWCYVSTILTLICTGYFILVAPFWIIEAWKPYSVLHEKARQGICYEPTLCCSCLWHVV